MTMIFQYTYEQVLRGEKNQTRRRICEGDAAVVDDYDYITAVTHNGRMKYAVGSSYAVQPGRNEAAVGRIQLTQIDREPVATITEADAIAEGYATVDDFLAIWEAMYGLGALDEVVWVLTFRLLGSEA